MKIKLVLLLAVLFGIGSAFTSAKKLTQKYVILQDQTVLTIEDAVQENIGQCLTEGEFCKYVWKSNPPNPTDPSDPDNYERDPESMDEHFVEF